MQEKVRKPEGRKEGKKSDAGRERESGKVRERND